MIAATARVHDLVVATRNRRDFEQFEVEVLDPFAQVR
jgi:predicted nucleic acid-binding protein